LKTSPVWVQERRLKRYDQGKRLHERATRFYCTAARARPAATQASRAHRRAVPLPPLDRWPNRLCWSG